MSYNQFNWKSLIAVGFIICFFIAAVLIMLSYFFLPEVIYSAERIEPILEIHGRDTVYIYKY